MFALREIFRKLGYESRIFSSEPCAIREQDVEDWQRYPADEHDVLLIHYSLGAPEFRSVFSAPGRKALLYHGVTPARFIKNLPSIRLRAEAGENELVDFASRCEAAIAHSDFTAEDLRANGYPKVDVLPYTLWERLYDAAPDPEILDRYRRDDRKNLLVVGRIMPHKRVEDSLFVLDYLRNRIGAGWRLILVGSANGAETYREKLVSLAGKLNLSDITWAGAVSQAGLIAFYQVADAFLLTSEHEGFGVPLIEAMRYDVPVFACANAAVPEVLADSGVLFHENNWPLLAEAIQLVATDPKRKEDVLTSQRARRECFSRASSEQRWQKWLDRFR